MKTLADPTRRAVFEAICRSGSLTVGELVRDAHARIGSPTPRAMFDAPHGTLTPVAGGTRLRLAHEGFGAGNESAYDAMSGGWGRILSRIDG